MEPNEAEPADSWPPTVLPPAGLPVPTPLDTPSDPGNVSRRAFSLRRWSPADVEKLRELAGSRSVPTVAEFLGRTPKAIRSKLFRVGGPAQNLSGFKSKDLVNLLHVTARQIRRWRERGYLETTAGRITERSFERFCREHRDRIPYNSLDQTTQLWLRSLGYPSGSRSRERPR